MKAIILSLALISLLFITFCSPDNPLAPNSRFTDEGGGCYLAGLIIHFTDSISYEYAIAFLAQFDSVKVEETSMGVELSMYSDSADFEYWTDFYKPDSSFFDLHFHTLNDSLTLLFNFLSDQFYMDYKDRIINNPYLHFSGVTEEDNSVFVSVPDSSEIIWQEIFSAYDLVQQVDIVGICND